MMLRQFQKIKKIFLLEDNLRTKTDLSMCIILYYQNYQDFEYFQFFIVICHQVKVVDILVLAIHQIHRLEVNQNIILMARGHHYLLSVNKQSFN